MAKNHRRRKGGRRPIRQRNIRKTFHIICEGKNTEPDYFDAFPLNNVIVRPTGLGQQHKKLVESTINYIENEKIEIDETEEVWVVFDFDIKEDQRAKVRQDFNEAIRLAVANKIKCAVSNDCFELWYYLHFQYTDAENRREFYYESLGKKLNLSYQKDKKVSTKMYEYLLDKQPIAIKNAENLEKVHKDKLPHEKNPYTSVYVLVEALNEYL